MNKRPIQVAEMVCGETLSGNIVDAEGNILFRQGLKLTPEILSAWQRRADKQLYLAAEVPVATPVVDAAANSLPAISQGSKHFQQWLAELMVHWDLLASGLAQEEPLTLRPLEACFESVIDMVELDSPSVIHSIMTDDYEYGTQASLARRSGYLTALSAVVAHTYGLDRDDCCKVCMSAALHDVVLYPPLLSKLKIERGGEDALPELINSHGMVSNELLSDRLRLPDQVRVVIQQVHEQMDGRGTPRGLPGHLINIMARIINLADAFLTLIAAADGRQGYVPADAIAHLTHHTSRGALDRDCMRAFLEAATMYGIGSRVILEDGREATVLRGVPGDPLHPWVDVGSTSEPDVLDLANLRLKIKGPAEQPDCPRRKRMLKSQMGQQLWRTTELVDDLAMAR